jgi:hypothetical protein
MKQNKRKKHTHTIKVKKKDFFGLELKYKKKKT